MKLEFLLAIITILIALCVLLFGDNIYAQFTGNSVYSPSQNTSIGNVPDTSSAGETLEREFLPTNSPTQEIVSTIGPSISGIWVGTVNQPGYGTYETEIILVECRPITECGTVNYPDLSCGGKILRC